MNTSINPATLKSLREAKKMSQEQLIREVKTKGRNENFEITKRQLQRIEQLSGKTDLCKVRDKTLTYLAKALGVQENVLKEEYKGKEIHEAIDHVELKIKLSKQALVKLELVEHAYEISIDQIIALAPLFFVYHAESSLRERREKLEKDAVYHVNVMSFSKHEHEDLYNSYIQYYSAEDNSINSSDIFGWYVNQEATNLSPIPENPFIRYLQKMSRDFRDHTKLMVEDEYDAFYDQDFSKQSYSVCNAHLDRFTGGNEELKNAIFSRKILIKDIPEICFELDVSKPKYQERQKWIEDTLARLKQKKADDGE